MRYSRNSSLRRVAILLESAFCTLGLISLLLSLTAAGHAQVRRTADEEFGPVVRAYLGYLRNEQEVVDDRVSRREITATYYRRNSNRIRALRHMAIQIARQSHNDYIPELEAVTRDEFRLLFEPVPRADTLRVGQVIKNTFRFLATVHSGETFYIFARLDPYEQMELTGRDSGVAPWLPPPGSSGSGAKTATRSRRVLSP